MSDVDSVIVRRQWNSPESAAVAMACLADLRVRDQPGGVCGPLPRGFLQGRVWCDQVVPGFLGHACHEGSRPHEIVVCILPSDNPAVALARLRAQARD